MLDFIRWILTAIFAFYFVGCSITNIAIIIQGGLGKLTRPTSLILLVGGVSGTLSTLVAPIPLFHWWWLPLLIDPGCSMWLLAPYFYVRERLKRRQQSGEHGENREVEVDSTDEE